MAKLVDTSYWIEAIRVDGKATVKDRVRALGETGEALWCDVVRLELWNGCRGERDRHQIRLLELSLNSLPIDEVAWNLAVALIRKSRDSGFTFPVTDVLIAACAVRHGIEVESSDGHFVPLMEIGRALPRDGGP